MTEQMDEDELIEMVLKEVGWICGAIEEMKGKIFVGGCGKTVKIKDAFKCTDCTAPFHRKCAIKHFKFPMGKKPKDL